MIKAKFRKLLEEIETEYGLVAGLMLRAERMSGDPFSFAGARELGEELGDLAFELTTLHDQVLTDLHDAAVAGVIG